jgi:hypothetical protein
MHVLEGQRDGMLFLELLQFPTYLPYSSYLVPHPSQATYPTPSAVHPGVKRQISCANPSL